MAVKISTSRCIGCGTCVGLCPNEALVMQDGQASSAEEDKCESCGLCVSFCEQEALTFRNLAIGILRLLKIKDIAKGKRACGRDPELALSYIGI